MKKIIDICPAHHKMALVTYQGHQFLTIYTKGGKYVGLLDFDLTSDELGDWSRLFALGALTLSDLL